MLIILHEVFQLRDDILLLCSDGLTDLVDDWLIESVMEANSDTLDEGNQALNRMANDRGGKDNITVMMVRIDDAHVADAQAADTHEEEVTDPRGIASVEELTDPGYVDEEATDEAFALAPTNTALDAIDDADEHQDFAFDETQPELPRAPAPAKKSPAALVEVKSGATTAGKVSGFEETEPELIPPGPSVIIDFDDTSEELPSFIIDLD